MLTFAEKESLRLTWESIQPIVDSEFYLYRIQTGASVSGHLCVYDIGFSSSSEGVDEWQVQIDSNLPPGHAERVCQRIVRRLTKRGCRVEIVLTNVIAQKRWEDETILNILYPEGQILW